MADKPESITLAGATFSVNADGNIAQETTGSLDPIFSPDDVAALQSWLSAARKYLKAQDD